MSSPLEKFILENREKFDADTPDPRVWEKISEKMDPRETDKVKPLRSLPFKRWFSAAAAVVALGLAGILYLTMHRDKTQTDYTNKTQAKALPSSNLPTPNPTVDSPANVVQADPPEKRYPGDQTQAPADNGENKEMYYYAKLIELKHEELKTLEKDEPLLYRQFSGDVQKLDSVYHSLKTQLPKHSNREQVIEAMISNLQLQIGLLNKQLDIIKQIKHSKKSAYEKAYKSV
jgi:hypothetical protein